MSDLVDSLEESKAAGRLDRAHVHKGFEQWGRNLGDEVMATALLDRLLHRCHIVNVRGNSYRIRRNAEPAKALYPLANRIDGGPPAATEALS